jgi:hypothetical protein
MRFLALIRYCLLMFSVTVVGMFGLIAFIQEGNWPMVALFAVAEPAAGAITLRLFYVLIWGEGLN